MSSSLAKRHQTTRGIVFRRLEHLEVIKALAISQELADSLILRFETRNNSSSIFHIIGIIKTSKHIELLKQMKIDMRT